MAEHGSILGYFFQAGFIVKFVMLILLLSSIASWTLIIQRAWFFKQKKNQYKTFKQTFWGSRDLAKLYNDIHSNKDEREGLALIFYAGFKEFLRMSQLKDGVVLESIQRVMQIHHFKEAERVEEHLPLFASIGSLAPYVGLFGTVWGIMTSFQALGQASQATIAMVAPGISEALVATAFGLFTAIPAVVAFNRYSTAASGLLNHSEIFQDELVALIAEQSKSKVIG